MNLSVLNIPVPHAGTDHTTLTGMKRQRIEPESYVDHADMAFKPPFPGPHTIGVNAQASVRNINPPIPVVYSAIPFMSDGPNKWLKEMRHEMMIFVAQKYPQIPPTRLDARRVGALPLPQLHYLLHEDALAGEEIVDPAYVEREWFLAGVLQNHPDSADTPDNYLERTINLLVKGEVFMLNVWGDGVTGGDHLWLVIKEVEVTPETRYVGFFPLEGLTTLGDRRVGARGAAPGHPRHQGLGQVRAAPGAHRLGQPIRRAGEGPRLLQGLPAHLWHQDLRRARRVQRVLGARQPQRHRLDGHARQRQPLPQHAALPQVHANLCPRAGVELKHLSSARKPTRSRQLAGKDRPDVVDAEVEHAVGEPGPYRGRGDA